MAPVYESKTCLLKSGHCELEHEAENSASPLLKETNNTISSEQTQKLAYDNNDEIKRLKTKEALSDRNNGEKHTASVEYPLSRASSSKSTKDDLKESNLKDIDTYIDKMKQETEEQLHQKQFDIQHLDEDAEKADSQSDTKATPKVEIPTELESISAHLHVQGITKFSEDGTDTSKEDDSDEDDTDEDNPANNGNEVTASEEADVPVPTQSNRTNGEDSHVPIVEATECTSPVGKEKPVVGVMSATIPQAKVQVEPTYMPVIEGKNSNLLHDSTSNDHVSLSTTSPLPSKTPLDNLPREEKTQNVNDSTELVINQPSKNPENAMAETGSLNGATKFLTVENVEQLQTTSTSTIYPYFSALTGSAGESPMESSCDSSEQHTQDEDNDNEVMTLDGSVSDRTSFQSGSADAFDQWPDM